MCRQVGDIMRNDPIIQDIQAHIDKNNLSDLERLQLRVQKHNYAKVIQIQEDVNDLKNKFQGHIDNNDCHTPKGILVRGEVIAWAIFIAMFISIMVTYLPEKLGLLITP